MDRLLLDDLQRRIGYPCATILANTTPGSVISDTEVRMVADAIADVDRRLTGDVADDIRKEVVRRLHDLLGECTGERASHALALCATTDYSTAVRLGQPVVPRTIVDDSFATRDLVADVNRSATFRVLTVSGRRARLLRGDRARLVEQRDGQWPLERHDESASAWARRVAAALEESQSAEPLPTVLAGVSKSIRAIIDAAPGTTIGVVRGNHDRTSWSDLHSAAWPVTVDWLRSATADALGRLDHARSRRLLASGVDEVWTLAVEGRVDLVVVESGFSLAVRLGPSGELLRATDVEAPDVVDDIVDDTIEAVLRSGGRAVIVDDGTLTTHGRIAAALRY